MRRYFRSLVPWAVAYFVLQALLIAQFENPWRDFMFPSANFLVVAFGLEFFRPKAKWNGLKRCYAGGTHALVSRLMMGIAVVSYAISIVLPFLRLV